MKYFIATFGCQMNKSDSERIAALLENTGYKKSRDIIAADLIVVNMCSIRQSAVDRIDGLTRKIIRFKALNPRLKTILTGCVLKKDRRKFENKFDSILDIKDLNGWKKYLKKFKNKKSLLEKQETKDYLDILPKYENNFSALVPISHGCNNFCAYCVVPYSRGPLVARDHNKIIKEIKSLIKKDYKEIWLLGQNVNDYRSPANHFINFSKLLKLVNNIPGNFWIRFTSPHPKNFSDELIDAMANCKKFAEYLNLPVQSGDNKILKKMNRNYTVKEYKNLVKKIRKKIPQIKLSTDAIVGFPGETKSQFQKTVKLFKKIKFDWAYISKYSPRSGTAAFKLKNNVPLSEKKKREKILRETVG